MSHDATSNDIIHVMHQVFNYGGHGHVAAFPAEIGGSSCETLHWATQALSQSPGLRAAVLGRETGRTCVHGAVRDPTKARGACPGFASRRGRGVAASPPRENGNCAEGEQPPGQTPPVFQAALSGARASAIQRNGSRLRRIGVLIGCCFSDVRYFQ